MNRIVTTLGLSTAAFALVLVPGNALATPTAPATPTATTTATAPAASPQTIKVAAANPTGKYAPVIITVTGVAEGQWVDVDGHPKGWTGEAAYHKETQQTGSGPMRIVLEAPVEGWPAGSYEWTITLPGGVFVDRTTTFTPKNTNTPKPTRTTKPAQSNFGGLARTGV